HRERTAVGGRANAYALIRVRIQYQRCGLRGSLGIEPVLRDLLEEELCERLATSAGRQGGHDRMIRDGVLVVEKVAIHGLLVEGEAGKYDVLSYLPGGPLSDSSAYLREHALEREVFQQVDGR